MKGTKIFVIILILLILIAGGLFALKILKKDNNIVQANTNIVEETKEEPEVQTPKHYLETQDQ